MNFVNLLHAILVRRKICSLFLWLGKNDSISHYCPQSSELFSYINICNINRKFAATSFHMDVKYFVFDH